MIGVTEPLEGGSQVLTLAVEPPDPGLLVGAGDVEDARPNFDRQTAKVIDLNGNGG